MVDSLIKVYFLLIDSLSENKEAGVWCHSLNTGDSEDDAGLSKFKTRESWSHYLDRCKERKKLDREQATPAVR